MMLNKMDNEGLKGNRNIENIAVGRKFSLLKVRSVFSLKERGLAIMVASLTNKQTLPVPSRKIGKLAYLKLREDCLLSFHPQRRRNLN